MSSVNHKTPAGTLSGENPFFPDYGILVSCKMCNRWKNVVKLSSIRFRFTEFEEIKLVRKFIKQNLSLGA
jgi:hypothetical protein